MMIPAISSSAGILWALLGSLLLGGAIFLLCWTLLRLLASNDLEQDESWRYDVSRINALRGVSPLFRFLQPVIQGLARINSRLFTDALPEMHREIQAAGLPRYWTAGEYLARLQVLALIATPLPAWMFLSAMGMPGIVPALLCPVLLVLFLRYQLTVRSRYRLFQIKKRLPFLLDLLTLLMEAGSTFLLALEEAVAEFRDHPVGQEFGRVLAELGMGKNRTAALEALRQRLSDDEITSIIGSIIQGEELGTPLAVIFRTQADVLRIKRTQRAETMAGEAGVKMLAPAVIVMASTVIIILGPFVLSFIYADFF